MKIFFFLTQSHRAPHLPPHIHTLWIELYTCTTTNKDGLTEWFEGLVLTCGIIAWPALSLSLPHLGVDVG